MYLALRVTRTLIAPILLQASTDPSISMQATHPTASPLAAFAGLGNIAVIAVGLVLLLVLVSTSAGRERAAAQVG